MKIRKNKEGKRFIPVSDEDIKSLPEGTRVYYFSEEEKAIAPPNCKHDFYILSGIPTNIKGCRNCIYWEYTKEPATE